MVEVERAAVREVVATAAATEGGVRAAAMVVVAMEVVATVGAARVAVERERSRVNRSSSPRCAEYGPAREARASRIRQQRPGS